MKKGFTLVELMLATALIGVVTVLCVMTFSAVSNGWQASMDYLDRMQRTDYAVNQLVIALRSAYYPSSQNENYRFFDPYEREGNRPGDSDIIEWTKKGSALIGSESAMADSVHKVRVMVLEEGDTEDGDDDEFTRFKFREPIKKTGLYARAFVDPALAGASDDEKTTNSRDYYQQPVLIADGVVGFRCRTLKEKPSSESGSSGKKGSFQKDDLEDAYKDGKYPYLVELTIFIERNDSGFLSQGEKVPIVRVVELPIYNIANKSK